MGSLPSDIISPLDPDNFLYESSQVLQFIADYYRDVEKFPVQSQVQPGYLRSLSPKAAPLFPEQLEAILADVQSNILPGLTHWQSPNFFAYFQANASTAGFLGEMLCTGLNVVGFNWIASPAATELENIVVDWVGKMLNLPQTFLFSGTGGGVLYGSTCEALVCTLAAARDMALKEMGANGITELVVYSSDQTHFSLQKAAKLVGILPNNIRMIPTSRSTSFALEPSEVRSEMEKDSARGLAPLFLCATIGTTASGAVDPLKELGQVAQDFNVWLHVDAAYAGSACICPEFRQYLDGVELADSLSINPHKWLLTNMDCCCLWLQNPNTLIDSLGTSPECLKNKASELNQVVDYKDWQIALSRRFRALKLWVLIRRYGVANLRDHIRSDVKLAKLFEAFVRADKRFEVAVPRRFALVCFRLVNGGESEKEEEDDDDDEGSRLSRQLLEMVNSSGRAYMSHAVVGGKFLIRCAIGGTLTEERHVVGLWKLIQEKAALLLKKKNNV
ncbi:phenylacetaldehyde synthase-like isoform X1 [Diospyros lotus]|uniref:phenylacetaldehyde synthase-like isoform X1 n=1 Tax=Diospyros lotus TaxID=55363 RepID=UPI00224E7293|nr:phenylacetaldehyde synthase-like isoform X1 [Diospyros lotus]